MNDAPILPLGFTADCAEKVAMVVVNFFLFVLGLIIAVPNSVAKGLKEFVSAILGSIVNVIVKFLPFLKALAGGAGASSSAPQIFFLFKDIVMIAGPKAFVTAITKYMSFWTAVGMIAQLTLTITAYFATGGAALILKIIQAFVGILYVIGALVALWEVDKKDNCFSGF
jgi:hypothetical protein